MSLTYQAAFLVISVTAPCDSTRGCFHGTLRVAELVLENDDGEPPCLYVRQSHGNSAFGEPRGACVIVGTGEIYKSEFPVFSARMVLSRHCPTVELSTTPFADIE